MVGERIREARLAQSRSLADIAAQANISIATLSRIENDKQSVDVGLFLSLARVLNVPPADLLGNANATDDGGDGKLDPIVRRIASLDARERLRLWRDLATQRRAQRNRSRVGEPKQVAQQVDELLAQMDLLREELESVRKRIKLR